MAPTQHVLAALLISALVFIIAGDSWNARVSSVVPVTAATKK